MFKLHTIFSPFFYIILHFCRGNPNCNWASMPSGLLAQLTTLRKKRIWIPVFSRSIWVLRELIARWTQHFTKIDQEKCKIEQICIWNPMTVPDLLCKHYLCHQYGISVTALQMFFLAKHCQQQGMRRYGSFHRLIAPYLFHIPNNLKFQWQPCYIQMTSCVSKHFQN